MTNLKEIRGQIDRIDQELVVLMRQRMEYALQTERYKTDALDQAREESVFRNVTARSSPLVDESFLSGLYELILRQSRDLQQKQLKLVGFLGEHGSWSELAVQAFAGALGSGMAPIPCLEFRDVFARVANGDFEFGVVPVENSIEGSVAEVNDLLIDTDLKIVAEAVVPIHNNLLTLPGTNYQEIKSVYSHPQALGQCRAFLARNKLEPRPFYNTAGAARWLARERPRSAGVIASRLAAELYGLDIVKENIEDHAENATRFVLLSTQPGTGPANKCTIAFSTAHRVGALADVIQIFAKNKLNLTRIESRPVRENPGAFAFLLDFQGKPDDPAVQRVLEQTQAVAATFKNLGFYEEAKS